MKSPPLFLVIFFCLPYLASSYAWADVKQDWKTCKGKNYRQAVKGCTSLIKNKRLNKTDRAKAYGNRGNAYKIKGKYDKAITDFNKALSLKPNNQLVYNNKAEAVASSTLLSKISNKSFPPDTMNKLMTLELLFQALKAGIVTTEDEFMVSKRAAFIGSRSPGNVSMRLPPNTFVKIVDLIKGVAILSAIDATIVISEGMVMSESVFVKLMNKRSKEIGLTHSNFVNATGLDVPGQRMSARDLAILLLHLIKEYPQYYHYFSMKKFKYRKRNYSNKNPQKDFFASDGLKTGFPKDMLEKAIADYDHTLLLKKDWESCTGDNYQIAVQACTRLIKNKRLDRRDRAAAYGNRGSLYRKKGLYGIAIKDYTQAIKIETKYAEFYYYRGVSYSHKEQHNKAITDYTQTIKLKPENSASYNNRGLSYHHKTLYDKAIKDYNKSIKINPNDATVYNNRGNSYFKKGLNGKAVRDYTKALKLNPKYATAYNNRGGLYGKMGQHDKAISDLNQAIKINPQYANAYGNRGTVYSLAGQYDKAIRDHTKSITINPKHTNAYAFRGLSYTKKGMYDKAFTDLSKALNLNPKHANAYAHRGFYYAKKGILKKAIEDYDHALRLESDHEFATKNRADAVAKRKKKQRPLLLHSERRIALVISNSQYDRIPLLANPRRDGKAVAATLRTLGFSKVTELYDANLQTMTHALKKFGDLAEHADWAMVYFAGHGIEVGGKNYLLPIDVRLARAKHVLDEALPLSRVLDKVEDAKKVRLVILDACRNNPFIAKMVQGRGANRSVGRGLARIEPRGGVLVAYAARDGQLAEDGRGKHSPYTTALLHYLKKPGLEINMMFRQIRAAVQKSTKGRQTPYEYGALPPEALYFHPKPN